MDEINKSELKSKINSVINNLVDSVYESGNIDCFEIKIKNMNESLSVELTDKSSKNNK